VGHAPAYKYPSTYRGLAAAFDDLSEDATSAYAPGLRNSHHYTRDEDLSLIDPFADELEQEENRETVALRGLEWLRRNVSSLRVTVSLQRTPPSKRKPSR
jgi:hypothetical protein